MFAEQWESRLAEETNKPYFLTLSKFLRAEITKGITICPPPMTMFRALQLTDFDAVRVVVLGQDPYHGPGQANGLAFAVNQGIQAPPSLKNIFQEIKNDIGTSPSDTSLLSWAKQGVLLLNTILSVRQGQPFSHHGKGWEQFTDTVIMELNDAQNPIVFLLWGSAAQLKQTLISPKHSILQAPHPSPLSAYRGFFGCRHFSQTNQILKKNGLQEIKWQ